MARNLLGAGHEVTVYNRTREKAESVAADGAQVAASPAEATPRNVAGASPIAKTSFFMC